MKEVTIEKGLNLHPVMVEEQYKMREVTTGMAIAAELSKVEEQYKMNVKEVTINMDSVTTKVEGQYSEIINIQSRYFRHSYGTYDSGHVRVHSPNRQKN